MWKREEWDQFGYRREEAIQYLQGLFQLKQYNRCVVLVNCLLTNEISKNSFLSCQLLHILVVSLLRTDHIVQANKALERLWDIIEHNKEFTKADRNNWRACYMNDKREASECQHLLHKTQQTRIASNASFLSSVDKDNYTLSTRQSPAVVGTRVRRDLCGYARSLLESTQKFLLQQLNRKNVSAKVSSIPVASSQKRSKHRHNRYQKKNVVGDERVELHCMEKALEVLMQHKPFNKEERLVLFKSIGSLALEYVEKLLRAGTVVKSILPRTAENLYLALETMERYLEELPEPLPSFAHSQLKLVRLLIILGSENFTPFVEKNIFLDHAAQMVEELLHELMNIFPPVGMENDEVLREVWNAIHARLTASVLETKGNILIAQGQYKEAVELFKQSIEKYDIATVTATTDIINTSEYNDIYFHFDEYFKDDNNNNNNNNYYYYMDNVPFKMRLQVKLAEALSESGCYVEALELLSSTKSILDTTLETVTSGTIALFMYAKGNALSGCNRIEEARRSYEMVLEYLENRDDDLLHAVVMDRLAKLSLCRGNIELSLEYYRHALRLRRRSIGEFHLDTAASHRNLSETLYLLHRYKEAENHADACMRVVKDLYTGVFARQLYGNISTLKKNRNMGFLPIGYDIPSGMERENSSLYLQHPLYAAAARRKSECIRCRLIK
ncbi:hypothetical protein LSM04_008865 [Trypanosoma melophagium]|uniref:uncharacterized protein n=1 Tax=Trypanosoma melophagium TaxID=715481 RepID=UPI003519D9BC|nr:hypothetical protein LSM04_008865 [Trypanosoma melophagium]